MVKGCGFVLARGGGCLALVQGLMASSRGDTGGMEYGTGTAADLRFDDSYGTVVVTGRRTWVCIVFNTPPSIYLTLLRTRAGVYATMVKPN